MCGELGSRGEMRTAELDVDLAPQISDGFDLTSLGTLLRNTIFQMHPETGVELYSNIQGCVGGELNCRDRLWHYTQ